MTMDPWSFWRDKLGSPKYILAPMVDHSELPWRMLSREYGCQVAYSPMYHAGNFVVSHKYRDKMFSTCAEDRPLIIQFCANNPDTLVSAAKMVEDLCDGIDLNLGCPQEIARRGRYGAFLQNQWELIDELVTRLRSHMKQDMAVSCKIRRFDDVEKTIQYAQMLEKAGCTFLGIHARTREQRGNKTGRARWEYIKAVKDKVHIPVIANGNVVSIRDADRCMEETGADAVMTAEPNLNNPAMFADIHPPVWVMADKYLKYVEKYPIPAGMAKAHLFKMFHKCIALEENLDLRVKLGQAATMDELYDVIKLLRDKYAIGDDPTGANQTLTACTFPLPPYLCQPRFRSRGFGLQQSNGSVILGDGDGDDENNILDFPDEMAVDSAGSDQESNK